MSDSEDAYRRARARVEAIRGWYVHVIVYAIVNAGLFVIDLASGDGLNWFYFPLLGWGIGLGIHTAVVWLGTRGPLGPDWEQRKIRELLEQEERRSARQRETPPGPER